MSKKLYWILVVSFLVAQMAVVGCSDDSDDDDIQEEATAEEVAVEVMASLAGYVDNSDVSPIIKAEDVNTAVTEEDDSYMLIDVRPKDHFDGGHVEGAINIPYGPDWALAETLEQLDMDKKIVIICHTGHKASFLTLYLTQLDYEAYAMKFGMMGWTTDNEVIGIEATYCDNGAGDFTTDTEAVETETFELPGVTSAATADELIMELAGEYWNGGNSPVMKAGDINTAITEGDESYQIVSIRAEEDYDLGHITGAINLPYGTFIDSSALAPLDPSKKIIVVCYTGHTASQITMMLNELGYEAYSLAYGMMGWVTDSKGALDCDTVPDYAVVTP